MRTRRNRKGGEGAEVQSPMVPEAQPQPDEQPQPEQVPEAQQQAVNAAETIDKPSGNGDIDEAVSRLYDVANTNYHLRALINAITICNFTLKSKSNLLNPLDAEVFLCEGRCNERANMVREALKILNEESEKSDVLGYISSGRGMVNSAAYLGNSGVSLLGKAGNAVSNTGSAVWNTGKAVGKAVLNPTETLSNAKTAIQYAPTAASNAFNNTSAVLNKSGENITRSVNVMGKYADKTMNRFGNYVTSKFFTPKAPVKGGRRRTRRHR